MRRKLMIPSSDWNSYPSTQVKVGTFFSNSCARRLEFMQRCNSLRKSTTLQRKDRSGNKNLMVWLPEMFFFRRKYLAKSGCRIQKMLHFRIPIVQYLKQDPSKCYEWLQQRHVQLWLFQNVIPIFTQPW